MKFNSETLGTTPIRSLLLKMSIPATIGMMANALYNLVDTFFVGHGVGINGLGGLAIAYPIQMILMAFSFMVGQGAASILSRAIGANDEEKAHATIGNALLLIFMFAFVIVFVGSLFLEDLLIAFGATEEILPYAFEYVQVILLGYIFFGFVTSSNNLIRAEGNAKASMIVMLVGIGVNLVLDPIFIFDWGLGLGIRGAAIATVIGQFASFIFIVYYIFSTNTMLRVHPNHFRLRKSLIVETIQVGFPSFIRNFLGSFLAILVNRALGIYGTSLDISVYGTFNKVILFMFMPSFGLIQALQPIIGYNYGAKKFNRVFEVLKLSLKWIFFYFLVATILGQLFPRFILTLFISGEFSDAELFISKGATVLRIVMTMIPVVAIQIVTSTLCQAIGKARQAFIISVSRQLIFFIPLVLILPMYLGVLGVWLTYPLSDFFASILSIFFYRHETNELHRLEELEG
jgi:putative MATE family efflux protein